MKIENILITGGTGFIGRNLIKWLDKKYNIAVISRSNKKEKGFVLGDLMDVNSLKKAFKNVDLVIHLAFSKNYPENIIMARNLVELSKKNKINRIILVSSMAAKRDCPDNYGKTKQEVEKIIINSGINYTILRPSIIYGKGSTSFNFMINYIKKLPFVPIIGSGKYKIYPVHIEDVVWAIEKSIYNGNNKEYDLPGADSIYFIGLINELKRQLNIKKPNIKIPVFFCKIISLILPKILSKENIKNLTQNSLADIENSKEDLGYNPRKFQEGVKNGIL